MSIERSLDRGMLYIRLILVASAIDVRRPADEDDAEINIHGPESSRVMKKRKAKEREAGKKK